MVKRAIQSYYDLLDKRLKEGTSIILIIFFIVYSVWIILSGSADMYKTNLWEYKTTPILLQDDIVTIGGVEYKVILQEVK